MSVTIASPRVLEELSWSEKQLPQYERTKHVHGMHPYLGKYVPQLVEYFLKKYFREANPGNTILDPFVGSGTTLVECNVAGRPSVGLDISEFNVLLSHAKLARYLLDELGKEVQSILTRTQLEVRSRSKGELDQYLADEARLNLAGQNGQTGSDYLKAWYHPNALAPLLVFRNLIPQYRNREFMNVLLSRAARSSRLAPHHELDSPKKPQAEDYECYKHHRICHPTTRSLPFLVRYGKDLLSRVSEFQRLRTDVPSDVFWEDARSFQYSEFDLCGVISSPPYVGLIDYHRQHEYAYELLGLTDRALDEIGRKFLGNGRGAVERYEEGIASALKRIADRGLEDPGLLILVVNDRLRLYEEIVDRSSLRLVDRYRRRVDRRTGRRAASFYEDILILSG